jgi:ParB family chromosome partitioning protein
MSRIYVPFSTLRQPKDNPRRVFDKAGIKGLAKSIKKDGVLQNLVVIPEGDGEYRVHIGKRRYFALEYLERKGEIDSNYKVPVVIKRNLDDADALRIATVENVQREPLDPVDEAEAFASLLQNGAKLADVAAETGVSEQTVRRRLALANLSDEAKSMVRAKTIPLSVAEAMTLGSHSQQQLFIDAIKEGATVSAEQVRDVLLAEKPSVSLAIFPIERYTGTYTQDLFGDETTTLFDDVEQFMRLQNEAVQELAAKHKKKAAFVDVLNAYSPPWWQYRKAEKGEPSGVVIHHSPMGTIEVRKGLVKHQVEQRVATEIKDTPLAPAKVRPEYGPSLCRYATHHKSIAALGALMANQRKMLEVAAVLLLSSHHVGSRIRIEPHSCIRAFNMSEEKPKGYNALAEKKIDLLSKLGLSLPCENTTAPFFPFTGGHDEGTLYQAVQQLSDTDLVFLVAFIPLCAFGQNRIEQAEAEPSLLSDIAHDLSVSMREWWTPDEQFLSMLKRSQLEQVAIESGASLQMARLQGYKKSELVRALAQYFVRTASHDGKRDGFDPKGSIWLPEIMTFAPADNIPAEKAA